MSAALAGRVTLLALLALASFTPAGLAWAKPATTLRIPETTSFNPLSDKSWFLRGDVQTDLPFQGAQGAGASVGRFFKYFFVDLSFMYHTARYGAVNVYQPGSVPVEGDAEIRRNRSTNDRVGLLAIGPGIGTTFKLFESERWVEMARFGLNYAQMSDGERGLTFNGALANFTAAFGYTLGKVVIAPGLTWNLGFLNTPDRQSAAEFEHKSFLPTQWFSWHLGLYFWL